MTDRDRIYWIAVRQAALMFLDALEKWLLIQPTTADIRKWWKANR